MAAVTQAQMLAALRDLAPPLAAEKALRDAAGRPGAPGVSVVVENDLMYTRVMKRVIQLDSGTLKVWLFMGRAGATADGVRAYGDVVIIATELRGTERNMFILKGVRATDIWADPDVGIDFAQSRTGEAAAKPEEAGGGEAAEAEPAKKRARSASPPGPPPAAAQADGPDDGRGDGRDEGRDDSA